MPGHSTWLNYLLPGFQDLLAAFRRVLGVSWLNRTPIEIQYVLGSLLVAILLVVLSSAVRSRFARGREALIPDECLTLRGFFEMMVEGTLGVMEESMGRKAAVHFLPLIGSSVFVIFFSNFLGMIPGFLPPTSNLSTTAAMALVVFVATHAYGVKEHGLKYFAHWFGPIRKWYALPLMLLMFGIEVVSHLARPVSLAVRLMGNMTADHLVVATFTLLVPILVPLPVMLLGVLVCIVQTAVFAILSTVYIGMAIAHEEH